jgi:hypothetical protein
MKTNIAALMLVSVTFAIAGTSLDERPCTSVWAIEGKVLSVVEDQGVLVICAENTKIGLQKPNPGDVVFVHGNFPNSADGDLVNIQACEAGRFRYIAASGAAMTVRAFNLRH